MHSAKVKIIYTIPVHTSPIGHPVYTPFLDIQSLKLHRFRAQRMLQSMDLFTSCPLEFKDILSLGLQNTWTFVINQPSASQLREIFSHYSVNPASCRKITKAYL